MYHSLSLFSFIILIAHSQLFFTLVTLVIIYDNKMVHLHVPTVHYKGHLSQSLPQLGGITRINCKYNSMSFSLIHGANLLMK